MYKLFAQNSNIIIIIYIIKAYIYISILFNLYII